MLISLVWTIQAVSMVGWRFMIKAPRLSIFGSIPVTQMVVRRSNSRLRIRDEKSTPYAAGKANQQEVDGRRQAIGQLHRNGFRKWT